MLGTLEFKKLLRLMVLMLVVMVLKRAAST